MARDVTGKNWDSGVTGGLSEDLRLLETTASYWKSWDGDCVLGEGGLGLDWELQENLRVRLHEGVTGRTGTH